MYRRINKNIHFKEGNETNKWGTYSRCVDGRAGDDGGGGCDRDEVNQNSYPFNTDNNDKTFYYFSILRLPEQIEV